MNTEQMSIEQIKRIIEGALLAAGEPLTVDNLQKIFLPEEIPAKEIKEILQLIMQDYDNRVLELKEVASGYRFQVRNELSPWIGKMWEEKPPRYSRALLETLAMVAYRQPITRAEIEDIRGVAVSSHIVKTLLDRDWIKIVGHREVPGRPALYATTKQFLDDMNLQNLEQLPTLEEIKQLEDAEQQLALELNLEAAPVEMEVITVEENVTEKNEMLGALNEENILEKNEEEVVA